MINSNKKATRWSALPKAAALLSICACTATANAQSDEYAEYQLTNEQLSILQDPQYAPPEQIDYLTDSFSIPLISLTLSAARNTTNTDQFSIVASYKSVGINLKRSTYLVDTPHIRGMDFSAAIKKKCSQSPQTLFDDFTKDGVLGFNLHW